MNNGWIGVDLDGTLAEYYGWKGADHIGTAVPAMVERVKKWLEDGVEVRIFTARVYWDGNEETRKAHVEAKRAVQKWSLEHLGTILPVTATKDYGMVTLFDDRAIQVMPNTGVTREDHILGWLQGKLKAFGLELRQGQADLEILPIQVPAAPAAAEEATESTEVLEEVEVAPI